MLEKLAALTPGAFYRYVMPSDGEHYFSELGERIENFIDVPRDELYRRADALFELVEDQQRQIIMTQIEKSRCNLSEFHHVFCVTSRAGNNVWLEARAMPERADDGTVVWTGFVFDVTKREVAFDTLQSLLQNAELILDNILDAIITTDGYGRIVFVNKATEDLLGYQQAELKEKNINCIMPQHHRAKHDGYMQRYQTTQQPYILGSRRTLEVLSKRGQTIPVELRICEFQQAGQKRFMGTLRDLRPILETEKALAKLRTRDMLTGLRNRSGLLSKLASCLNADDTDSSAGFCLLVLDIDDFRFINEGFGVSSGDDVLLEIAERLRQFDQETLCLARIQEDEFAILVRGIHSTMMAKQFFEKLKQQLEAPIMLGGLAGSLRFSGGACLLVAKDMSAEDVLHNSEIAMGLSKQSLRGQLTIYEQSFSDSYRSSALIDQKLKSPQLFNELFLEFQPQLQASGMTLGYEALIRWKSDGVLIRPDEFIPIAERNGTILLIGEWLMEQACVFLKSVTQQGDNDTVRLSINISPIQFQQANFVETVLEPLEKHDIDPKRLHLELTERLLIESTDHIVEKMSALSAAGITFSLDDFGTGYSSLAYLSRLPLSELKIDKSFIRSLEPQHRNYQIVQAIIKLSQSLGLNVIAEGVETESELESLKQLGCFHYQGYYFSRPIPGNAIFTKR